MVPLAIGTVAVLLSILGNSQSANKGSLSPSALRKLNLKKTKISNVPKGYTQSPYSFVRGMVLETEIDPDERGRADQRESGIFHVTTNLPAVLKTGRLMSRRQLRGTNQQSYGLGGGFLDESPETISTTISWSNTLRVYKAMHLMAMVVHEEISPKDALIEFHKNEYRAMDAIENIINDYIVDELTEKSDQIDNNIDRLTQAILNSKNGPDTYEAIRKYEEFINSTISNEGVEDDYTKITVSFTVAAEKFMKVKKERIGILRLAARKGARTEMVYTEKELRFKPSDLVILDAWGT